MPFTWHLGLNWGDNDPNVGLPLTFQGNLTFPRYRNCESLGKDPQCRAICTYRRLQPRHDDGP